MPASGTPPTSQTAASRVTHKKLREDQQVAPDPFAQNKTQWGGGAPLPTSTPTADAPSSPPPKKVVKPKKVAPPPADGEETDDPNFVESPEPKPKAAPKVVVPKVTVPPVELEADADGDMVPIGMSVPKRNKLKARTKIPEDDEEEVVPPKPSAADLEPADKFPQQAEYPKDDIRSEAGQMRILRDRIPDVIKATEPIKTLQGLFDCSMGPVVHQIRSITYDCNIAATDPDLGIATKVNLGKVTINLGRGVAEQGYLGKILDKGWERGMKVATQYKDTKPVLSKSGVVIKEGAIQPHLPFVLVPKPKPRAKAAKRVREEEEGAE